MQVKTMKEVQEKCDELKIWLDKDHNNNKYRLWINGAKLPEVPGFFEKSYSAEYPDDMDQYTLFGKKTYDHEGLFTAKEVKDLINKVLRFLLVS